MIQVTFLRDPYILASQAKQVFYSRENKKSSWYVALRGPSRRYYDDNDEDANADIGPMPSAVAKDLEMDEASNALIDCEGIYV